MNCSGLFRGHTDFTPKLLKEVLELMAGMNVEFSARMLEMVLHCAHAELQFTRDLIIAPVFGSEPRDFLFSNRQSVPKALTFGDLAVGRDADNLRGGAV